ncbi:MAG: SAM-dependent methyltransferase, partial [Chitinophagaceae bacterium]
MYSLFHIALRYLEYWIGSQNGRGHGIHSPFVYELVTTVFRDSTAYDDYNRVEDLRAKLLKDPQLLSILDLGAGSRVSSSTIRSISFLARHSAKPKKYAQLLFRLARYYQPRRIVELGTSLGLSTAYLALGASQSQVFTMEGCPDIAAAARKNFQQLSINNISLAVG